MTIRSWAQAVSSLIILFVDFLLVTIEMVEIFFYKNVAIDYYDEHKSYIFISVEKNESPLLTLRNNIFTGHEPIETILYFCLCNIA